MNLSEEEEQRIEQYSQNRYDRPKLNPYLIELERQGKLSRREVYDIQRSAGSFTRRTRERGSRRGAYVAKQQQEQELELVEVSQGDKTYKGKVYNTQAMKDTFVGVRTVSKAEQRATQREKAMFEARYGLRSDRSMSRTEFAAKETAARQAPALRGTTVPANALTITTTRGTTLLQEPRYSEYLFKSGLSDKGYIEVDPFYQEYKRQQSDLKGTYPYLKFETAEDRAYTEAGGKYRRAEARLEQFKGRIFSSIGVDVKPSDSFVTKYGKGLVISSLSMGLDIPMIAGRAVAIGELSIRYPEQTWTRLRTEYPSYLKSLPGEMFSKENLPGTLANITVIAGSLALSSFAANRVTRPVPGEPALASLKFGETGITGTKIGLKYPFVNRFFKTYEQMGLTTNVPAPVNINIVSPRAAVAFSALSGFKANIGRQVRVARVRDIQAQVALETPFWKARAAAIQAKNEWGIIKLNVSSRANEMISGARTQVKTDIAYYSSFARAKADRAIGLPIRENVSRVGESLGRAGERAKPILGSVREEIGWIPKTIRQTSRYYSERRSVRYERAIGLPIRQRVAWARETFGQPISQIKPDVSFAVKEIKRAGKDFAFDIYRTQWKLKSDIRSPFEKAVARGSYKLWWQKQGVLRLGRNVRGSATTTYNLAKLNIRTFARSKRADIANAFDFSDKTVRLQQAAKKKYAKAKSYINTKQIGVSLFKYNVKQTARIKLSGIENKLDITNRIYKLKKSLPTMPRLRITTLVERPQAYTKIGQIRLGMVNLKFLEPYKAEPRTVPYGNRQMRPGDLRALALARAKENNNPIISDWRLNLEKRREDFAKKYLKDAKISVIAKDKKIVVGKKGITVKDFGGIKETGGTATGKQQLVQITKTVTEPKVETGQRSKGRMFPPITMQGLDISGLSRSLQFQDVLYNQRGNVLSGQKLKTDQAGDQLSKQIVGQKQRGKQKQKIFPVQISIPSQSTSSRQKPMDITMPRTLQRTVGIQKNPVIVIPDIPKFERKKQKKQSKSEKYDASPFEMRLPSLEAVALNIRSKSVSGSVYKTGLQLRPIVR